MPLQLFLVLVAGTLFAGMVYMSTREAPVLAERFKRYAQAPEELPLGAPWWESWQAFFVRPIAPVVERLLPSYYLQQIHAQLGRAGLYANAHFQLFIVAQAALGCCGAIAGLVFGGRVGPMWALAMFAIGLLVPALVLNSMVRRRQTAINDVLSDSIDLLTASVEAGLGLDAAIAQLVRRNTPTCAAINQELNRYLQELQLGTGRADALRGLGLRTGVEDLRSVVTALVHGDALGVGVAQILRGQATHLRQRRKQRAEEQAMKAPIKILFPLLFGIFPSIFVLVLGPAVLRLMDSFIGKFS